MFLNIRHETLLCSFDKLRLNGRMLGAAGLRVAASSLPYIVHELQSKTGDWLHEKDNSQIRVS
jgi:hypothetical protein